MQSSQFEQDCQLAVCCSPLTPEVWVRHALFRRTQCLSQTLPYECACVRGQPTSHVSGRPLALYL